MPSASPPAPSAGPTTSTESASDVDDPPPLPDAPLRRPPARGPRRPQGDPGRPPHGRRQDGRRRGADAELPAEGQDGLVPLSQGLPSRPDLRDAEAIRPRPRIHRRRLLRGDEARDDRVGRHPALAFASYDRPPRPDAVGRG